MYEIKVNDKIIDFLVKKNEFDYNLHKASEECQELGLVLNQKLLKPGKVTDQEIIDEIGDVEIRLAILKRLYPLDQIQKRVDYKLSRYKEYKDSEKYRNI